MNILDTFKSMLGDQGVAKIAEMLGLDGAMVSKALEGGLPAILGGLATKASSAKGAGELTDLIKGGTLPTSLDDLAGSHATEEGKVAAAQSGTDLLGSIFGGKLDSVLGGLGKFSGLDKLGLGSLLAAIAPMFLGWLGKQVPGGVSNSSQFAGFLSSKADEVSGGLGGELKTLLGGFGLGSLAGAASGAVSSVASAASSIPSAMPAPSSKGITGLGWLVPLIVVGLAGLGWWYTQRPESEAAEKPAVATEAPTHVPEPSAQAPEPAPTANGMTEKELPGGVKLSFAADSVESKLIAFIEDASKPVDKKTWFTFNGLLFDTAKATLMPASMPRLQNVAAILNAYPNVKLKIGGYTDNVGNPDANLKLSDARAKTTMAELVKLGIAADRLAAEGFGDQFPVGDNNTDEGRQKNRRIDVRVTAK